MFIFQVYKMIIFPKAMFLGILVLCLHSLVFSQLNDVDFEDYNKGNYFYSIDNFDSAAHYFVKLSEKYPDNSNISYKTGLCYFNIKREENKAIPYFEKAVKEIDLKYYSGNMKATGAPPKAWYLLGVAYHRAAFYNQASFSFHNYLALVEIGSDEYYKTVERIKGLGLSYDARFRSSGFVLEKMPEINTEFSDYNPVVSGDGKTMAFTSHRKGKDRVYITYNIAGKWTKPKDITEDIGSDENFFTTALSFLGNELYLVNYDPYNSDIYVAVKNGDQWSEMKAIDNTINTKEIETGASISSGNDTLYFCSNRAGGYGAVDIYYSVKVKNKWSRPINIGSTINTPEDEGSPRISSDGKTFYFCSNGHESIGGFDIYWTEKDENGNWQTPIAYPIPINTPDDDMSFYIFDDKTSGYVSRLNDDGSNNRDIFEIKLTGTPQNKHLSEPLYETDTSINTDSQMQVSLNTDNYNTINSREIQSDIEQNDTFNLENNSNTSNSILTNQTLEKVIDQSPNIDSLTVEFSKLDNILRQQVMSEEKSDWDQVAVDSNLTGTENYTIQILALRNKYNSTILSNLKSEFINVSNGNDGICRYSYGVYKIKDDAAKVLLQLKELGFYDAFIRKTSEISNFDLD